MTDNRAAFDHFVELFYTRKRVAEAFDYLVADDYRQHNPNIPDGPAAAEIATFAAEVLRSDKRAIFTAASKAQEIADWMHAQQAGARQHEVRGAA